MNDAAVKAFLHEIMGMAQQGIQEKGGLVFDLSGIAKQRALEDIFNRTMQMNDCWFGQQNNKQA
ncbi:MAG: hypothetical protein LBL46_03100 [Rickettsiales bacterium]|jgi:hypothetical protein|nr:hypothetical protein [Rickettsiales bacterium]